MQNISITVPLDHNALTNAAKMFQGLAEGLGVTKVDTIKGVDAVIEEIDAAKPPKAGVNVTKVEEALEDVSRIVDRVDEVPSPQEVFGAAKAAIDIAPPPPPAEVEAPANRELDAKGMPWDGRIHASTKTKMKNGQWKPKRGVDADLVEAVEAEIKGTPVPVEDSIPAVPGINTYPEFIDALKANNIDEPTARAACEKHGLAYVPLVATRPDLIKTIAAELGL